MPRFLNVTCVTALMALVASGPLDANSVGVQQSSGPWYLRVVDGWGAWKLRMLSP